MLLKLSSPQCAIICAPSYKELGKTVKNVLEGPNLGKIQGSK
jgi:hypothetical protein